MLAAVLMAALTACAAPPRIAYDAAMAAGAQVEGFDDIRLYADSSTLGRNLDSWLPRGNSGRTHYLVLSGGGAGGAFSVGALKAWTETGNRPRFDMVSGVSTGALIAPFAFLGAGYDDLLVGLYTSGAASTLVDFDVPSLGIVGASLLSQEPLRQMVEKHITAGVLAKIAAEHRSGRRLVVLTTNLDSQRAVIWNMGAIAASGQPGALQLFQDVLIASASVPGIFPAVLIKAKSGTKTLEEMHSDGGSASQFLAIPESWMLEGEAADLPRGKDFNMYVIVNNALMPEFSTTRNSTLSVMARANAMVIKSQTRSALLATYAYAKKSGIGFQVAAIDAQLPYSLSDPFSTQYMQAAYRLGYSGMMQGTLWKEKPEFPPQY